MDGTLLQLPAAMREAAVPPIAAAGGAEAGESPLQVRGVLGPLARLLSTHLREVSPMASPARLPLYLQSLEREHPGQGTSPLQVERPLHRGQIWGKGLPAPREP